MGSAITGWGTAVPEEEVTNEELATRLDIDPSWISQRTGIEVRHIASASDSTASLAASAAGRALVLAGVEPRTVDAILVATVTPDLKLPATACLVQALLGATGAAAFDLNAGCSGFLYALSLGGTMVDSGGYRKVLVIGADLLSRITDYRDAKSAVLFGDGAGAVLVESQEGGRRVGPFILHADGRNPELLWAPPDTGLISMEGREVYRRAVDAMSSSVEELCHRQALDIRDIDLVVAHQANERILHAVAERLGLSSDQVMSNIANHGNTSAASIPLAIADAVRAGRLSDGDVVALTAFGAGFTWGAGLLRWGVWAHEVRRRVSAEVEPVA